VILVVAAVRIARFRRILRLAQPAPAALRAQVDTLARALGLARAPAIGVVPGPVSPLVWALGCRPCLLVPRGLWERLDEGQRTTLLVHELAHVRRRDHWVRGLELLVTGLYWWLPVVWIARRRLREAEEECCDAWVVWACPDAARTYAEALLETLDYLAGAGPAAAVAASGLGPVHHLKRRMTMIMQGTTPRALTWKGLFAVLGLSAILLPLAPSWGQQRPTLEEEFWTTLRRNHEFNDPRFPFLINAREIDGHTLIDATFKHRAGGPQNANAFDMVVQARRAEVQFYPDRAVARARLDGVELTNPREDVALVMDNQVLELPIYGLALITGDDEDEDEDKPPAAKRDERRDPGPRVKDDSEREREQEKPAQKKSRREARTFRFEGGPSEETIAALQKMLDELKEMSSRTGSLLDERGRKELERAISELKALVQRRLAEPAPGERRKPETGPRDNPEAAKERAKDKAEAEERRAEVARLRAEVAEHQKALMAAQKRLAEAMRRQGLAGGPPGPMPFPRPERFEFHFGGPGEQEKSIKIVPRADQDRRIAELEERLQKLQDEVKAMRKDTSPPK
jgi:hypothetical protein